MLDKQKQMYGGFGGSRVNSISFTRFKMGAGRKYSRYTRSMFYQFSICYSQEMLLNIEFQKNNDPLTSIGNILLD